MKIQIQELKVYRPFSFTIEELQEELKKPDDPKVRYEIRGSMSFDNKPTFYIDEYEVVKKTPAGAWIKDYAGKRWVKDNAITSRFKMTKKEALDSFFYRKKRHIEHLKFRLELARKEEKAIEEFYKQTGTERPYYKKKYPYIV